MLIWKIFPPLRYMNNKGSIPGTIRFNSWCRMSEAQSSKTSSYKLCILYYKSRFNLFSSEDNSHR